MYMHSPQLNSRGPVGAYHGIGDVPFNVRKNGFMGVAVPTVIIAKVQPVRVFLQLWQKPIAHIALVSFTSFHSNLLCLCTL